MKSIRFTKNGLFKLQNDYTLLLKSRPAAVLDLKKAREMGDLSENGYYKASRAKLSSIDHRLLQIKSMLKHAVIVDNKTDAIGIGNTVVLLNDEKKLTYQIVGDLETNPSEGKISLLSPLGKLLEGKKEGQQIVFHAISGTKTYLIMRVY